MNARADPARAAAYDRLVETVFGVVPPRPPVSDPPWESLAYFAGDGTCVAGIEIAALALVLDGGDSSVTAIRLAGVAPAHRGRGLFVDLMESALHLAGRRGAARPTLLYTENEALYRRFGFVPLPQHAFVGRPPSAATVEPARSLDRREAEAVVARLAAIRAPVSLRCAVRGAGDLLRANLDDDDLRFAVLGAGECLVVYETDGADLVIIDVVARTMPTMVEIVAALSPRAQRVRTLFSPDRLDWEGLPTRDDTGLMIRGRVPAAMQRPFMLPPTTSF